MAADIAKLWALEEIAAAGHHELAANLRTAINELVKSRTSLRDARKLERERCARECESLDLYATDEYENGRNDGHRRCAESIRALPDTEGDDGTR